MKTLLILSLLVSSPAWARNIFEYDDTARAEFQDVHTNHPPEPPVYVEIENNQPAVRPNDPVHSFEAGIRDLDNQRREEAIQKAIENIDRNEKMEGSR